MGGSGHVISKAHCEHDGSRPIIGPNIPLGPLRCVYSLGDLPVLAFLQHKVERNRDGMGEDEIKYKDFYERPIPLIVYFFDEQSLD